MLESTLVMLSDSVAKLLRELSAISAKADLEPYENEGDLIRGRLEELGLLQPAALDEEVCELPNAIGLLDRMAYEDASATAMVACALSAELLRRRIAPNVTPTLRAVAMSEAAEVDWEAPSPLFAVRLIEDKLFGKKVGVPFVPHAEGYAILFSSEQEAGVAWVAKNAAGLSLKPQRSLGIRAARRADITLNGVDPEAVSVLPMMELKRHLAEFGLLTAACAHGAARRSLEEAWTYAGQRYQGGRNIAGYDAVKLLHRKNVAALETAWAGLERAARAIHEERPGSTGAALRAKASASRAAVQATMDGIQILGGNGYMRDYGQERRFRDTTTLMLLPLDPTRTLLLDTLLE